MSAVVYTLWGVNKRALYVGCTRNIRRRMAQHECERPWMVAAAVFIGVTEFPDWETGHDAEVERIVKLRPLHNVMQMRGNRSALVEQYDAVRNLEVTVHDRKHQALRLAQTGARLFDADLIDHLAEQYKRSIAPLGEPA